MTVITWTESKGDWSTGMSGVICEPLPVIIATIRQQNAASGPIHKKKRYLRKRTIVSTNNTHAIKSIVS